MLVIGQILRIYNKKYIYLTSIALFELGSLICALSNTLPLLIFGRAVAGCGGAGSVFRSRFISWWWSHIHSRSHRIQIAVSTIIPDVR